MDTEARIKSLAPTNNHQTDDFIAVLVKRGVVKEEDTAGLREKYVMAEDIFDALLKLDPSSEEKLVKAYADYRRADYIELKQVDASVLAMMPRSIERQYQIVPYELDKRTVKLAVANPVRLARGNLAVIKEMERKSGLVIEISYTTSGAVKRILSEKSPVAAPSHESVSLPLADLSRITIPLSVVKKLPQEVAEQYKMIVFRSGEEGKISVGLVNPDDKKARNLLSFVEEKNNIKIELYRVSYDDFRHAVQSYEAPKPVSVPASGPSPVTPNQTQAAHTSERPTGANAGIATLQASDEETNLDSYLKENLTSGNDLAAIVRTGNIPKMVAGAIKLASLMKSSDVHIEAEKDVVLIRYRIDGKLREVVKIPIGFQKSVVARVKILAKLKIDESRIPQDGRFEVIVDRHSVDLRVSVMPSIYGEKIVLRLLDKNAGIFKLDTLGMGERDLKLLTKAIEKPYGVLLVTGPTGSGKSTTLYAGINHLKSATVNIVTLEDPVEYEMSNINQVQVKPQIGFTFAEGLRAVLRQDPNIIMVGEIRDTETANLVTHAALTGHMVLTTLHTNNAAGAMPRLINMGVEPFLISSAINAIVAQRLVRKICDNCKAEITVPPEVRVEVEKEFTANNITTPIKFFEGRGCSKCTDGYKGRTGIYEVLEVSNEIEDLIIKRSPANQILEVAIKQGMTTMRLDGFLKAVAGVTTIDEVMQATMLN